MPSSIAWLDNSAEERRRAREIVALFSQPDSRDELGIGQIRDVLSDLLFPGTSVIQTRARYFLFVPWLFEEGARHRRSSELLRWVDRQERLLIEALRSVSALDGLIGRQAGTTLKILPSAIYWSGLERWGILRFPWTPDQVAVHRGDPHEFDGADERVDRASGPWHPTLPSPPSGFPGVVVGGFSLTSTEAGWLRERILSRVPGSMLAHLVRQATPLLADSVAPWDEPATRSAPGDLPTILEDARLFSLAMHGAALLYNLLVAERYEHAGFTAVNEPVHAFREELNEWRSELTAEAGAIAAWDRKDFWHRIQRTNPRITPATWEFVDSWITGALGTERIADDTELRRQVRQRELRKKRQARLANEHLLPSWSGSSGTAHLTFRWTQIHRIVTDILEGLEAPSAGT